MDKKQKKLHPIFAYGIGDDLKLKCETLSEHNIVYTIGELHRMYCNEIDDYVEVCIISAEMDDDEFEEFLKFIDNCEIER